MKIIKVLFSTHKKREAVVSTPFSDFIRNATSEKKKKVYTVVLQKATERQVAILTSKKDANTQAV